MKRNFLPSSLAAACALTSFAALSVLSGPARADALDKARIPADARWFAHLDLDALKRSELFTALQATEKTSLTAEFGEFAELGLNPMEDVRSIGVYCVDKNPERAVLLLVGNEHVDGALAKLSQTPSYRAEELDGRPLHVWDDDGEKSFVCVARREGSDDRLVVRAGDKETLRRALSVIDHPSESLAGVPADKNDPQRNHTPAPGSILYAAATTELSELGKVDMASNVTRLAKDMRLDIGEARGEVYAMLDLEAASEKEARQLQQVMQGALALVSLAQGEAQGDNGALHQPLQDFANAFQFSSSGSRTHCEFRMSVSLLLQDLRRWEAADDDDDEGGDEDGKK